MINPEANAANVQRENAAGETEPTGETEAKPVLFCGGNTVNEFITEFVKVLWGAANTDTIPTNAGTSIWSKALLDANADMKRSNSLEWDLDDPKKCPKDVPDLLFGIRVPYLDGKTRQILTPGKLFLTVSMAQLVPVQERRKQAVAKAATVATDFKSNAHLLGIELTPEQEAFLDRMNRR